MLHAVILSLVWLQAQPAATPPQRSTAMIVGRVIDASSGAPLPGATVNLGGAQLPGIVPPRLMTDPQGRFIYRNLPAGSYVLNVTKPGYLNGAYGRRRHDGPTRRVELAAGERTADVAILMWRPGAITGTIVDEVGEPMVSVTVRAFRRTRVAGRMVLRSEGTTAETDDRGIYRFSGLQPGEYLIAVPAALGSAPTSLVDAYRAGGASNDPARRELNSAYFATGVSTGMGANATRVGDRVVGLPRGVIPPTGDGLPSVVYPTTYYPGALAAREATVFTLRSGEEKMSIDIAMQPAPAVKVSGMVVRPDGPAAHHVVELEAADHSVVSFGSDNLAPVTVSDPTGAFLFPAVPAGNYTLRVTKMPASPAERNTTTTVLQGGTGTISTVISSSGPMSTAPLPPEPSWWAALPLQVGRRDITGLQVPLQEGARFSGRIEFDGTRARPEEDQLRRANIMVLPADGTTISGNRPAYVEPDGRFKTLGVSGGRYILRIANTLSGWSLKSAIYQGRDIADRPIDVSSGEVQGIVVTFTDRPAGLTGTVRGASGPDPDASVIIFPVDPTLWGVSTNPRRMRITRAGKDGAFTLADLPPGAYYVLAIPDDVASDWDDPKSLEAYAREATQVDLDEGAGKKQDLRTVTPRRAP